MAPYGFVISEFGGISLCIFTLEVEKAEWVSVEETNCVCRFIGPSTSLMVTVAD
jgi:hypothetical protein